MEKAYKLYCGGVKMLTLEKMLKATAGDVGPNPDDLPSLNWGDLANAVEQAADQKFTSEDVISDHLPVTMKVSLKEIAEDTGEMSCDITLTLVKMSTLKRLQRMASTLGNSDSFPSPAELLAWEHVAQAWKAMEEFDTFDKSDPLSKALATDAKAIPTALGAAAPTSAAMKADCDAVKKDFDGVLRAGLGTMDEYSKKLCATLEHNLGAILEAYVDEEHVVHYARDKQAMAFEQIMDHANKANMLTERARDLHIQEFATLVNTRTALGQSYQEWDIKEREISSLEEARFMARKLKNMATEMAVMTLFKNNRANKRNMLDQRKHM